MIIEQEPASNTTFQLDPGLGEELRSLILQEIGPSWNSYVQKMGLQPTNVFNYLSGRNRMTIHVLQKLLAGTDLRLICSLSIQILKPHGSIVNDADCMGLEEMLYSTDLEESDTELNQTILPSDPSSYSSEKPQDHKKITQEYPLRGDQGTSFVAYSNTQQPPSLSVSQTPLDADQPKKDFEENLLIDNQQKKNETSVNPDSSI